MKGRRTTYNKVHGSVGPQWIESIVMIPQVSGFMVRDRTVNAYLPIGGGAVGGGGTSRCFLLVLGTRITGSLTLSIIRWSSPYW